MIGSMASPEEHGDLREAVRELLAEDFPGRDLAIHSLIASSTTSERQVISDELAQALASEQVRLDLRIDVGNEGHETRADKFGVFARALADAVKEGAKSLTGRQRMPANLLISPLYEGSIGVTFRVPDEPNPTRTSTIAEPSNVESEALRLLVSLINKANSADIDSTDLTLAAQTVNAATRSRVRAAAKAAIAGGWELEGVVRQRDRGPVALTLDSAGAKRLESEMSRTIVEQDHDEDFGFLTGHDWDEGTVRFASLSRGRTFRAAIHDRDLHSRVALITVQEGVRVRASFSVVSSYPPGERGSAREVRVLEDVVELERPQGTLSS